MKGGGVHTKVLVSIKGIFVFHILDNGLVSVEDAGISGRACKGI
jgi:hypothetical protein